MDGGWYVSWHGKVQGPLPWTKLQELARLGRLKPEMHLSRDQCTWTPASHWSDLFAPAPPQVSSPSAATPRKPPSRPAVLAPPAMPSRASRDRKTASTGAVIGISAILILAFVGVLAYCRGTGDGTHRIASGEAGGDSSALDALEGRFTREGHAVVSAAALGDAFDKNEIAAN